VPGARSTEALGIDNAGDVVGTYTDSSGRSHGFLYGSQGVLTTIDVPGSTETFVNGINNLGTIVGSFTSSVSGTHGFIYEGGVFTMVDAPSGITQLLSINDLGEIVLRQGNGASYLATPVPEPSDFALVGIGLCGLLCIRKIGFRRDR
jgi:probable HAF family extracellular repeat protein